MGEEASTEITMASTALTADFEVFTNNSFEKSENQSRPATGNEDNEVDLERLIAVWVYPIIVLLGTFWNVLTFIVMQKGSLKRVSSCFYMSILAVADTGKQYIQDKFKSKIKLG